MKTNFKAILISIYILFASVHVMSKIILPHNLRYLQNMLNAEVLAKAAKLRQQMENNPNLQAGETDWPALLAKFQEENKAKAQKPYKDFYGRRVPNL